jgi:uncharacterized protein YecT (DUF1311 family)
MMRNILLVGFLVCTPAAAVAQADITDSFSKAYQDCQVYGEVHNTISRVDCSDREYELQDSRLNALWKDVMGRLSPQRKADLRADQRNWITARDTKCVGADDDNDRTDCKTFETIKRIQYLRRVK